MTLGFRTLSSRPRMAFARLVSENWRGTGLTVGAGWAGRLATAATQFIGIRLLSAMLGVDSYAAYAVITGLTGWFVLADLGFGTSLQNHISADRVGERSSDDAVWGVTLLLLAATVLLSLAAAVLAIPLGPRLLAHFTSIDINDRVIGLAAFAFIGIATGTTTLAQRILFAEHRGYIAHALSAGGAVLGLAALAVVAACHVAHPFVWALVAYNLPPVLLPAGMLVRRVVAIAAAGHAPTLAAARRLLTSMWRQARMFLLFNALAALVLNVDYIILSQTVPPRETAIYAIYAKIYALVFFVYNSILQAYWPVSAEAIGRGTTATFRRLIPRAIGAGAMIVLAASMLLLLLLRPISSLLVPHGGLTLPGVLVPLFASYWLVRVWCDTFGMLILSANRPLFLCVMIPFQATLNLTLGYWGARHAGLPGLIIGMTCSFMLTGAWAAPMYLRRVLRQAASAAQSPIPAPVPA